MDFLKNNRCMQNIALNERAVFFCLFWCGEEDPKPHIFERAFSNASVIRLARCWLLVGYRVTLRRASIQIKKKAATSFHDGVCLF